MHVSNLFILKKNPLKQIIQYENKLFINQVVPKRNWNKAKVEIEKISLNCSNSLWSWLSLMMSN